MLYLLHNSKLLLSPIILVPNWRNSAYIASVCLNICQLITMSIRHRFSYSRIEKENNIWWKYILLLIKFRNENSDQHFCYILHKSNHYHTYISHACFIEASYIKYLLTIARNYIYNQYVVVTSESHFWYDSFDEVLRCFIHACPAINRAFFSIKPIVDFLKHLWRDLSKMCQ